MLLTNRLKKFLTIFAIGMLSYNFVQAQQDFRCAVRLTFDSDNTGSVANYVLSLQLKNTKGRNVNGASILYKDSEGRVLGNTFLDCLNNSEGIKPGSYGNCTVVLQRVNMPASVLANAQKHVHSEQSIWLRIFQWSILINV